MYEHYLNYLIGGSSPMKHGWKSHYSCFARTLTSYGHAVCIKNTLII